MTLSADSKIARPLDPSLFPDGEAAKIAGELAKGPQGLTLKSMRDDYNAAKGRDPERAAVLVRMIKDAGKPAPSGSASATTVLAQPSNVPKSKSLQMAEELHGKLDKRIVGQETPKRAIVRALRAKPPGKGGRPTGLILTGPSGVGKTEFAKGITETLHEEGIEPVVLEGAMFQNSSDLAILEGSSPGLVGSDKTDEISPVSQENIDKLFKGKKPLVILIDEIDDIAPAVRSGFWTKLNKAFDEGYFKLKDGTKIDLTGALFIITSNAGLKTVGKRTGEARAAHFTAELKKVIPEPKILNRIGLSNIVACEPLTHSDLKEITANRFLKPYVDNLFAEARAERGVDLKFDLDPAALDLICRLGKNDDQGARIVRTMIEQLIQTMLRDKVEESQDEDLLRLRVKPGLTDIELNKLAARFTKAEGLPGDMDVENCPFEVELKRGHPVFAPYGGEIPMSPLGPPVIHASGAFAGNGFLVYNQCDGEDSLNELVLVNDGAVEAEDKRVSIKLPAALAEANRSVAAVAISHHEMYLTCVNVVDGADKAESKAFIFDRRIKDPSKAFRVAPAPLPLVGATMNVVDGKVLITGGRPVIYDEYTQSWSVYIATADEALEASLDPESSNFNRDNGGAVAGDGWLLDPAAAKPEWEPVENGLQTPRAGSASVTIGDKVYIFGGAETVRHASGTEYSRASTAVDIFDAKTGKFTAGQPLPSGIAQATAAIDYANHRVLLLGGMDFNDNGAVPAPKRTITTLALTQDNERVEEGGRYRVRADALPSPATSLATIARLHGLVVGPFRDEDGNDVFQSMT